PQGQPLEDAGAVGDVGDHQHACQEEQHVPRLPEERDRIVRAHQAQEPRQQGPGRGEPDFLDSPGTHENEKEGGSEDSQRSDHGRSRLYAGGLTPPSSGDSPSRTYVLARPARTSLLPIARLRDAEWGSKCCQPAKEDPPPERPGGFPYQRGGRVNV